VVVYQWVKTKSPTGSCLNASCCSSELSEPSQFARTMVCQCQVTHTLTEQCRGDELNISRAENRSSRAFPGCICSNMFEKLRLQFTPEEFDWYASFARRIFCKGVVFIVLLESRRKQTTCKHPHPYVSDNNTAPNAVTTINDVYISLLNSLQLLGM
jgi:hypothetical protein